MAKIVDTVLPLATSLAEKLGLELVDVEYVSEGGRMVLRVLIDKTGGVTLDDCEAMNRALSDELDRTDPIEQSYVLEVSSPGIERPLKKEADFIRFTGRQARVRLFSPFNGRKNFTGILRGFEDQHIVLETEQDALSRIPLAQVAKANLLFEESLPGKEA